MNKVVEVLSKARDLIQNSGWTRGTMKKEINGRTCYCSVGAIDAITRSPSLREKACKAIIRAVNDDSFDMFPRSEVIRWNDENVPNRDKRYVIRTFNKAINQLAA